ncbi:hypothetical protein ACHQM5_011497 [Ranunculus cassubicifolius]
MANSNCCMTFPEKGRMIRVLSIDGGGVKGLIPGVILEFLETKLQELDGPEVRLCDYFDVVASTSTGGLIATMITAPNDNNRPLYEAKEIVPFYLKLVRNVIVVQQLIFKTLQEKENDVVYVIFCLNVWYFRNLDFWVISAVDLSNGLRRLVEFDVLD